MNISVTESKNPAIAAQKFQSCHFATISETNRQQLGQLIANTHENIEQSLFRLIRIFFLWPGQSHRSRHQTLFLHQRQQFALLLLGFWQEKNPLAKCRTSLHIEEKCMHQPIGSKIPTANGLKTQSKFCFKIYCLDTAYSDTFQSFIGIACSFCELNLSFARLIQLPHTQACPVRNTVNVTQMLTMSHKS